MIEQKRLTAEKCRIKDVVLGRYVAQEGYEPGYVLTDEGRKLSRVHILATVTGTYLSTDRKYAYAVLDDGTGIVRVKAFQDTKIISGARKGDIVDVIGRVRHYNGEVHLYPEIVKMIDDPNYETLRKIEIVHVMQELKSKIGVILAEAKEHKDVENMKQDLESKDISKAEVEEVLGAELVKEEKKEEKSAEIDMSAVKDLVIKSIGELDTGEGVEYTKIIEMVGLPEKVSESAIEELLSEGSCYEPRAGKIRAL